MLMLVLTLVMMLIGFGDTVICVDGAVDADIDTHFLVVVVDVDVVVDICS